MTPDPHPLPPRRFVILEHTVPAAEAGSRQELSRQELSRQELSRQELSPHWANPHWDLMLEHHERLLTWALEQAPAGTGAVTARRLADHRIQYLTYEGPVSGNRGSVRQWDAGTYSVLQSDSDGFPQSIQLHGSRLACRLTIDTADNPDRLFFHPSDSTPTDCESS